MDTVATHSAPPFPDESRVSLLSSELLARFALVTVAVGICYCFHWRPLRFLTSEANLRLDLLAGIPLERLSYDTVSWKGVLYRYENACTFVDVWFGCIPLLWNLRRSIAQNLAFLAVVTLGLFTFNVFRLSVSDVLFAAGLSWELAHNVISGVAYFLVWIWIWEHRPF
jgi:hypothetical protein